MSFDESFSVDEPSLGYDSELNDTRDSFFETPRKLTPGKSSTPKKTSRSLFKAPRIPLQSFGCSKCKKKFRTDIVLKKHIRSHVITDAALQVITKESVKNAFDTSVESVLSDMIKENNGSYSIFVSCFKEEHNTAASLKIILQIILSVLCEGLVEKPFIMPSAMWGSLLCSVNTALNSEQTRSELKKQLIEFKEDCPSTVCFPFVLEFTHKVAAAVSTILTRRMAEAGGVKAPDERAARSADDFSTERDQSTSFHIFGFVVKHFLRKASDSRKSVYWKKIFDVSSTRFVKGGLVLSCPEGIEAWSASISRGSLTFVGEKAFDFFIPLAPVIQGMEKRDGSLEHEAVLAKVFNTKGLIALWDAAIGNSLAEEDATNFLMSVVKSVTNVMGVGIRDRRLNTEVGKGSVNVGLRSSLGPKPKSGSAKA